MVLNLTTVHISLQYHVVFNDSFHTVPSLHSSFTEIDDIFTLLYDNGKGNSVERFVAVIEQSTSSHCPTSEESPPAPPDPASSTSARPPPTIILHDFDTTSEEIQQPPLLCRSIHFKKKPLQKGFIYSLLPLAAYHVRTYGSPAFDAVNYHLPLSYHGNAKITRDSLDRKKFLNAP
jgi:hypothetical protein